jgi:PAS domain S-box-containing protein
VVDGKSIMTWNYAYTPIIWPSVFTVLLLLALAVYSGRRRSVPGATPFMISCLFAAGFAFGTVMETAAIDLSTKIFWFKFQGPIQMPIVTAISCFILDYAWPGRWLTRRNLVLLSIPCLLFAGLMLTNDLHHLMWVGFTYEGKVISQRGLANWIAVAYALGGLGALNLIVFGWLFLRSPQHRWAVVIILSGQFVGRMVYTLDAARQFQSILHINILGMAFEFLMYTIVLFGFRILDPIPLARRTVIQQLQTGMLVLDSQGMVVSLNPAAQAILGRSEKQAVNHSIRELLPACAEMLENLQAARTGQADISLGAGIEALEYQVEASPLKDWRGLEVGWLLLLHDVTEQKRAQAQLIEQQRALATLKEREQIARELHDELAQELALINVQAQLVNGLLEAGQTEKACTQLQLLTKVARETQVDVRGQISKLSLNIAKEEGFTGALRRFLEMFRQMYHIETELILPGDHSLISLTPTAEVQLLRIVQEAFINIRKHANSMNARVSLNRDTDRVILRIEDDGTGFDPDRLPTFSHTYGLDIMSERAAEINGSLEVISAPGKGTRITVVAPVNDVR